MPKLEKIYTRRVNLMMSHVEHAAFLEAARRERKPLSAWMRSRLQVAAQADAEYHGMPVPVFEVTVGI